MVLKKQTTFAGERTATVAFEPEEEGQSAGVAIWWSKWANAFFGIRGTRSGESELVFQYAEPEGTVFKVRFTSACSPRDL